MTVDQEDDDPSGRFVVYGPWASNLTANPPPHIRIFPPFSGGFFSESFVCFCWKRRASRYLDWSTVLFDLAGGCTLGMGRGSVWHPPIRREKKKRRSSCWLRIVCNSPSADMERTIHPFILESGCACNYICPWWLLCF